jgi:S1-C subfamily serine protease
VFGGLAAGAYWMGHREAAASDAKLNAIMSQYESSSKQLQTKMQGTNDTALVNGLERERDSLIKVARSAKGADAAVVQQSLQRHEEHARAITDMGPEAVSRANNPAIALIRTEIAGKTWEATGFGVNANGQVVTNRHVVDLDGARATKIMVKFANTDTWHSAKIARLPGDADVDLALLQIDGGGKYPSVSGVANAVDLDAGAPIVSIGFPEGSDLPMEGAKASTTLMAGIVSKNVPEVLQIDSYASHGSSGSPVFDSRGRVVGVIYGGSKEAGGKIVFAVPAPRIVELLGR